MATALCGVAVVASLIALKYSYSVGRRLVAVGLILTAIGVIIL